MPHTSQPLRRICSPLRATLRRCSCLPPPSLVYGHNTRQQPGALQPHAVQRVAFHLHIAIAPPPPLPESAPPRHSPASTRRGPRLMHAAAAAAQGVALGPTRSLRDPVLVYIDFRLALRVCKTAKRVQVILQLCNFANAGEKFILIFAAHTMIIRGT